jgi:hypothetical protein
MMMIVLYLLLTPFHKNLTNSVAPEPEGSSPHSQQPATGPCPEPTGSWGSTTNSKEFNNYQAKYYSLLGYSAVLCR